MPHPRSMFHGCTTNVSRAVSLAVARLNAGIERSNKWQAPACSFIFNRTVHLIPTRRGEMYAPRYRATPFLRWPTSLPLINLFSTFSRLIALSRATYVAKSSKNSTPLFLLIVKRGEEISIDGKRNGINSRYVLELRLEWSQFSL